MTCIFHATFNRKGCEELAVYSLDRRSGSTTFPVKKPFTTVEDYLDSLKFNELYDTASHNFITTLETCQLAFCTTDFTLRLMDQYYKQEKIKCLLLGKYFNLNINVDLPVLPVLQGFGSALDVVQEIARDISNPTHFFAPENLKLLMESKFFFKSSDESNSDSCSLGSSSTDVELHSDYEMGDPDYKVNTKKQKIVHNIVYSSDDESVKVIGETVDGEVKSEHAICPFCGQEFIGDAQCQCTGAMEGDGSKKRKFSELSTAAGILCNDDANMPVGLS